jgi:uncharacterized protein YdbL (DUF1318 family)
MRSKTNRLACLLISSLALGAAATACVTVNVNFPESAVQQATDDYVRDLYKAKAKGKEAAPAEKPKASFELIPSVWAAEEEVFKVNTPGAAKIQARQAERLDEVLALKRAGALGETKQGTLVVKDAGKLKPLQAKKAEKVVADENADRADLYKEVVKANGLPSNREKNVAASFARSFQGMSPSGTWIEGADGWTQKP